jgi:hypothetical protein
MQAGCQREGWGWKSPAGLALTAGAKKLTPRVLPKQNASDVPSETFRQRHQGSSLMAVPRPFNQTVVRSVRSDSPGGMLAWAGKNLENVGESSICHCDPRKLCEEWNL